MTAAIVGAVIVLAVGWMAFHATATPEPARSLQLAINEPTAGAFYAGGTDAFGGSEMSPDGRTVAFVGNPAGTQMLYVRPLDAAAARELPGTEGARLPFWSPDGRSIGFFASGKLKRIELSGGLPVTLCDVTSGRGGAWNADSMIIFNGYNDGPLLHVSARGGTPVPLTTLDAAAGENSHRFPQFLPDGRRFLYFVRSNNSQMSGIYIGSLDEPAKKRQVVATNVSGWFAAGTAGRRDHLLWLRNNQLVAQPFDLADGSVAGEPAPIADGPFAGLVGRVFFSASNDGTLLYEKAPGRNVQPTWHARDGKAVGTVGHADSLLNVKISPNGRLAAATRIDTSGIIDVWILELAHGIATRLTTGGGGFRAWRGHRTGSASRISAERLRISMFNTRMGAGTCSASRLLDIRSHSSTGRPTAASCCSPNNRTRWDRRPEPTSHSFL